MAFNYIETWENRSVITKTYGMNLRSMFELINTNAEGKEASVPTTPEKTTEPWSELDGAPIDFQQYYQHPLLDDGIDGQPLTHAHKH